jgi:hypothetical protein
VSNLALAELSLVLFLGLLLKVDTIGHNQVSTVPGAVQIRLLQVQVDTIGHNQVSTVPGAVQRRLLLKVDTIGHNQVCTLIPHRRWAVYMRGVYQCPGRQISSSSGRARSILCAIKDLS